MAARNATAVWNGSLREGQGSLKLASGAWEGKYSFVSRFENGSGTNPEELIAAAHAGCFSMALSAALGKAGFTPQTIETTATVHLEKVGEASTITRIELDCHGQVPGITEAQFQEQAADAKANCPVSRALKAVDISLKAQLRS